jgi:hypothetical protein
VGGGKKLKTGGNNRKKEKEKGQKIGQSGKNHARKSIRGRYT